jgi:prevent-host-death family protein
MDVGPGLTLTSMADTLPVTEAGPRLAALVLRATVGHERITLTDEGRSAVLIGADELADLEDTAALEAYQRRRASGQAASVPHDVARTQLLGE